MSTAVVGGISDWIWHQTEVYHFYNLANSQWLGLFSERFLLYAIMAFFAIFILRLFPDSGSAAVIVVAGIALRLSVATMNPFLLADNPLYDDSFYCFSIARNIASGSGVMQDSFHWTSGFQPLFVLLITPFFALTDDGVMAIKSVLILQTLIGAASGLALSKIVSLLTRETFFLWALAFWAFSPVFLKSDLNGLETNLSLLILAVTVYWYLKRFDINTAGSARYAMLGFLLGLGFLARVDNAILAAVLVLHILGSALRQGNSRVGIRGVAVTVLVFALVASPWLYYCLVVDGSVLPEGGRAVRFLSLAYGPPAIMGVGW